MVYFSTAWEDKDDCILFPPGENVDVLGALVHFVDDAIGDSVSVLMCSSQGRGRSAVACVAYLMHRYSWGADKAKEYLLQRKPDVFINEGFMKQLYSVERKQLMERVKGGDEATKRLILTRMRDWDTRYIEELKKEAPRGSALEERLDEEMLLVSLYLFTERFTHAFNDILHVSYDDMRRSILSETVEAFLGLSPKTQQRCIWSRRAIP